MRERSGKCTVESLCAEHRRGMRKSAAEQFRRALTVPVTRGILRALERHTPGWVICLELRVLCNTTARAFGVPERKLRTWSAEKALQEYAVFSAECLNAGGQDPARLYREAYRTGARVRRLTGFTEKRDLERLVFYLYRNLGIRMGGQLPGEVTVSRCYFSRFYTPEQCALMSHVDSGMIAGIFGGGKLEFSERITGGCGRCRAHFTEGCGRNRAGFNGAAADAGRPPAEMRGFPGSKNKLNLQAAIIVFSGGFLWIRKKQPL